MSLLKKIENTGASLTWCKIKGMSDYVALGTKNTGGVGFDDTGSDLEIHQLNVYDTTSDYKTIQQGSVHTSGRFTDVAWSEMANHQSTFPAGIIAGGMADGTVNIWDPSKVMAKHPKSQIASIAAKHTGGLTCLQFNPHKDSSHLLASGGGDSEVFIYSLDNPTQASTFKPGGTAKHSAEVTKVAWNTVVPHIIASAASNGSCIVWDLRQKKAWAELRDAKQGRISDICWNPTEGLQLITAMGDDSNPVIHMWDLRNSTSIPMGTMTGHTEGVFSVDWCPNDNSFLMSSSKDNRTLLWDLTDFSSVYELPTGEAETTNTNQFGGFGKAAKRRYDVRWSPQIPAVVGACSFDGTVEFYNLNGVRSSKGRPPKWLRRQVSATCGFGGKLVEIDNRMLPPAGQMNPHGPKPKFTVYQVSDDLALKTASQTFEDVCAKGQYAAYMTHKAQTATDPHKAAIWSALNVVFADGNQDELRKCIGYDESSIQELMAKVAGLQGTSVPVKATPPPAPTTEQSAEDVFGSDGGDFSTDDLAKDTADINLDEKLPEPESFLASVPTESSPLPPTEAQQLVKLAYMMGNYEVAVDVSLQYEQFADAFMIASEGGADLWKKVQQAYVAHQGLTRPFLPRMLQIMNKELQQIVAECELKEWKETLVILITHAKPNDFCPLVKQLGERLEMEIGDKRSAAICYLCSHEADKTVLFWIEEFREECAKTGLNNSIGLQELIEKVSILSSKYPVQPSEQLLGLYKEYAGLMATQGLLDTSLKYCNSTDEQTNILRDRIYNSDPRMRSLMQPPQKPWSVVQIGLSPNYGDDGNTVPVVEEPVVQQPNQQTQPQAYTAPQATSNALPPNWVSGVDQNTGATYYYNSATGTSQWERPVSAPVPAPAPVPVPVPTPAPATFTNNNSSVFSQPHVHQPTNTGVIPSKYSDGFPSSAGNATLAAKYGNNNTATVNTPAPAPAPTAAPAIQLSAAQNGIVTGLQNISGALQSAQLTGMERKKMADVSKSIDLLIPRLTDGSITPDTSAKLVDFVNAVQQKNFNEANNIQTEFVSSLWDQHKDWIKALKTLVQLYQKKC